MFFQRCFFLFVVLLVLIGVSPFMEGTRGTYLLAGFNAFVVLAAAAALGRTALSFLLVFCLIAAARGTAFRIAGDGRAALFNWALLLHALVYICVIVLLLRYVFGPEVMDGGSAVGRGRGLPDDRDPVVLPVRAGGAGADADLPGARRAHEPGS